MIHVLITVKESQRFPGKNRRLAPYTIVWLLNEIAYMEEPVQVYTVGVRSELPLRIPVGWRHIHTHTPGHMKDVQSAEEQIAPAAGDVMVLLQVTQPLREHGMLERAVRLIQDGNDCCVSAAESPKTDWRQLNTDNGNWGTKAEGTQLLMDGQIYAWKPGHAADIFNPQARHMVVLSQHRWGTVDVDVPQDIPPALSAMAAELLEPMNQPPLVVKGRKVLLIGSGKDLVGRRLGERIDRGEWDVVVRCNHFYGDPVDVGTRTDLAVVREGRFEKDFLAEAPVTPLRVLSTNDGPNFPRAVLQQAAQEIGHREASVGLIAARWLLNCGARLSAIGIGHFPDGHWIAQKTYPNGTIDTAGFCDWSKENAWMVRGDGQITLL